mmetsp:Transcript_39003/g.91261  ORF Transcript_39003/g.91261 Transcript_39003/m.91261 type:complete len:233 (+) Transcript_39003:414-1112(+)
MLSTGRTHGMTVEGIDAGSFRIVAIEPNGVADKTKQLCVGDVITQANKTPLTFLKGSVTSLIKLLQATEGPRIAFGRVRPPAENVIDVVMPHEATAKTDFDVPMVDKFRRLLRDTFSGGSDCESASLLNRQLVEVKEWFDAGALQQGQSDTDEMALILRFVVEHSRRNVLTALPPTERDVWMSALRAFCRPDRPFPTLVPLKHGLLSKDGGQPERYELGFTAFCRVAVVVAK